MEGERYQQKLGYTHYMELCAPQHFEKAFRDSLEIKKIAEPEVERSNLAYEQQRFVNFMALCVYAGASLVEVPKASRRPVRRDRHREKDREKDKDKDRKERNGLGFGLEEQ